VAEPQRCWPTTDPLYVAYHDEEWGRPVYEEHLLLERLCLEGFQSGLSWLTILRKRERFRTAFAAFRPESVARFGPPDVERLLGDAGIVRNRAKIEATIANARATVALHDAGETLRELLWSFAPAPPAPAPRAIADLPAATPESTALARELKRRGFRFVGPTTAYALMQACGIVDDHIAACFVREDVERARAQGPP
jgi:DNA-3-methyladenine glycosylase I